MSSGSMTWPADREAPVERAQRILVDHLHARAAARASAAIPAAGIGSPSNGTSPAVERHEAEHQPARSWSCRSRTRRPGPSVRPGCSVNDTPSTACTVARLAEQPLPRRICSGARDSRLREAARSCAAIPHAEGSAWMQAARWPCATCDGGRRGRIAGRLDRRAQRGAKLQPAAGSHGSGTTPGIAISAAARPVELGQGAPSRPGV